MQSIRHFLQKRLKLKVNEKKSSMDRAWKLKYLGFSMYKNKERVLIRPAPQTIQRVKNKIREFTSQSQPVSMADRIRYALLYHLKRSPSVLLVYREGYRFYCAVAVFLPG